MTRDEWWKITKNINFIVFDDYMYWTVLNRVGTVIIRSNGRPEEKALINWVDEMEDMYGGEIC
jgi:hypothetical protein